MISCASCKCSVGTPDNKLFCWLNSREADSPCPVYVYEAGTDVTVETVEPTVQQSVDDDDMLL